jgi:hypothetical protein
MLVSDYLRMVRRMCMMQLRSQGGDLLPEFLTPRYPARASYSSPRCPRPSIRSVHSSVRKVSPIDLSEERPTLLPFRLADQYSSVLVNSFSVDLPGEPSPIYTLPY